MVLCAICNAPEASDCAACHTIAYCSEKCQSEDAGVHEMVCKDFAQFTNANPRPVEDAVLAISFLPKSKVPKLVWTARDHSGNLKIVEAGESLVDLSYKDYLGAGNPGVHRTRILRNIKPPFPLDRTVVIDSRENFFIDGSLENKCVAAVAEGEHKLRWCGEIMVLSVIDLDLPQIVYQDVTATDLHIVAEFFKNFGDGVGTKESLKIVYVDEQGSLRWAEFEIQPKANTNLNIEFPGGTSDKALTGPTVQGVRIACDGSRMVNCKEAKISVTHDMFAQAPVSISKLMKLPLIVYRCNDQAKSGDRIEIGPNVGAFLLNLDFDDVKSTTWGRVTDKKWTREQIGSVLVARLDKKVLTVHQVEALIAFCSGPLHEVLVGDDLLREEEMSTKDLRKERKRLLREYACKTKFEEFFAHMKMEHVARGCGSWEDTVSPYAA